MDNISLKELKNTIKATRSICLKFIFALVKLCLVVFLIFGFMRINSVYTVDRNFKNLNVESVTVPSQVDGDYYWVELDGIKYNTYLSPTQIGVDRPSLDVITAIDVPVTKGLFSQDTKVITIDTLSMYTSEKSTIKIGDVGLVTDSLAEQEYALYGYLPIIVKDFTEVNTGLLEVFNKAYDEKLLSIDGVGLNSDLKKTLDISNFPIKAGTLTSFAKLTGSTKVFTITDYTVSFWVADMMWYLVVASVVLTGAALALAMGFAVIENMASTRFNLNEIEDSLHYSEDDEDDADYYDDTDDEDADGGADDNDDATDYANAEIIHVLKPSNSVTITKEQPQSFITDVFPSFEATQTIQDSTTPESSVSESSVPESNSQSDSSELLDATNWY